jgi:hypothetical protein
MTALSILSLARKFTPYICAVVILAAAIAYAHHAGYAAGSAQVQDAWDAERASQAIAAADASLKSLNQQQANTQAAMDAAARADAEQAQISIVDQTLTETVTKYVHDNPALAHCGLDAAGLRLWNAANAGGVDSTFGQAGDPQQSAAAMPTLTSSH